MSMRPNILSGLTWAGGLVALFKRSVSSAIILLSWNLLMAGPVYPLKLSPGNHYLVDQNNTPFFIHGDSAWLLSKQLTTAEQDWYISNRWVQGFNSIIIDMHPYYSGGGIEIQGETADAYGNIPFTNTIDGAYTNLLAINPDYFTNVDHVISVAASYGMEVCIYPMYDGYEGQIEGWWTQMMGNGANALFQYGQWVGNRFKNTPNLIYIGAGDFSEPSPHLWTSVADGILSVDTNHLFTAQAGGEPAFGWYTDSWCNLNCSYARSPAGGGVYTTYDFAITNYHYAPITPTFSREPYYELTPYVPANRPYDVRRYAWGSVTYGEAGDFYGNAYIATYNFTNGWQSQVWSQGAIDMGYVIKLMQTRPWWNCIPDTNHTTIVGGYGIYGQQNFITCMREATGKTAIAYIPSGTMQPVVDMTRISGSLANVWWYDPSTGTNEAIGTYNTSGQQAFTPPNTNDWVLVLDDASQNYGPPGVADPQPPVITADLTNQTAMAGATVSLGVGVSGATPMGFLWFFDGTNLIGATSNPLVLTNVTTANDGSYQVIVTNAVGTAASMVALLQVAVPGILAVGTMPGNVLQLTILGAPYETYNIQYTTNLNLPWRNVGSAQINASGKFNFYEAANNSSGFFRVSSP